MADPDPKVEFPDPEPPPAFAPEFQPQTNVNDYYETSTYPWTGTWKDQLEDLSGQKGMCETVPDYVVADVRKMQDTRDSVLRKIAEPHTFPLSFDDVENLARVKWKFENCKNCFSISPPQLGISKRALFYYRPKKLRKLKLKDKYPVLYLINPTYEPVDDEMNLEYEKCPSVKGVCGLVNRYETIHYKGFDDEGKVVEGEAFGLVSRWIQHEIDHLNGILFTDQSFHIITIKEHRKRRRTGTLQFYLDIAGI